MIRHVNNLVYDRLSMYALLPAIFLAILLFGCSRPPQVDPLRSEEYAVYKVIVDSLCGFTATIIIPGPTRAEVNFIGDSTLTTSDITRYGGCFDSCRVGHGPLFWLLPRGDKSHTDCVPFHEVFPYFRQHMPQYNWSEIQRDFDSINAASTLLDSAKFTFDIPTHFVPSSKVRDYYDASPPFRPKPIVQRSAGFTFLSRVAFDSEFNRALVYFTNNGQGGGGFAFLSKQANSWHIEYLLLQFWLS